MRAKRRSVFGDLGIAGEAEDLKATAVGQDRAVETAERMQPAEGRTISSPGPAPDDRCWPGSFAPVARTMSTVRPFTVPCVPTGMNAGMSTLPCGV